MSTFFVFVASDLHLVKYLTTKDIFCLGELDLWWTGNRGTSSTVITLQGLMRMLEEIEFLRFRMNEAYKKGLELTDGRMVEMSQDLDKLLLKYQRESLHNEVKYEVFT
ncbi:aspartyl-phosphate phosphatase Spo0E family protein [Paenibacillus sp. CAU 1523]|uniref:Aspartyl-phosphate phosphatase Spo0E family protein n=2 Tax=Paenibacillus arenosi TaxID=2774142 RepID=A0ABR9ATE0_9BACL|nr:aspartyl-phosphate phosphatase Spo0E family protein [Paenibacillus arenosi]